MSLDVGGSGAATTGTAVSRRSAAVGLVWLREVGSALVNCAVVIATFFPSLSLLVDGHAWWGPALVTLAVPAVLGACSRALTGRTWPGWLLALVVDAAAMLVVAVPSSDRLGPVPTGRTAAGIKAAWEQLASSMVNDVAPVRPIPEITAAVAVVVGLASLTVEACTRGTLPFGSRRRLPAIVIPFLLVPLLATSFVVVDPVGFRVLASALAGIIVVLLIPTRAPATSMRSIRTPSATATRERRRAPRVGHGTLKRAGRAGGTVATAGITAALAIIIAPVILVPNPGAGVFPVGSRFISPGASSGVDPFLDLSRDLRSPLSKDIVTYTVSDKNADPYLRSSVVSDLLSDTWGPNANHTPIFADGGQIDNVQDDFEMDVGPSRTELAGTGFSRDLFFSLVPETQTTESRIRVGINAHDYASPWLLLPQSAFTVTGVPDTYAANPGTSTLNQVNDRAIKGGTYSSVLTKTPKLAALRNAESIDATAEAIYQDWKRSFDADPFDGADQQLEDLRRITRPDTKDVARIPATIRKAADKAVAGSGDSPYAKALALRSYFKSGNFTYSESAPIRTDGKTAGVSMVEAFLKDKHGYCVHFASAMALLARAEGIPSRVAVGYTPGTATGRQGTVAGVRGRLLEVNSKQAHSWTELYFVGVGWVAFDPTPGFAGTTVDRAEQADVAKRAQETQAADDPVAGRGRASTPAESSSAPASSSPSSSAATHADGKHASGGGARGSWLWWVLAALVLVAAPGIAALAKRIPGWQLSWRERRIRGGGEHAARRAWVELARTAGITGEEVWQRPAPEAAAMWFPAPRGGGAGSGGSGGDASGVRGASGQSAADGASRGSGTSGRSAADGGSGMSGERTAAQRHTTSGTTSQASHADSPDHTTSGTTVLEAVPGTGRRELREQAAQAAQRIAAAVDRERYGRPGTEPEDTDALVEDLRLVRAAQN
jgi:transglutaminase-like putative cysteine protease